MSYEPTLVIKKSDLDRHSHYLSNSWLLEDDTDEKRIAKYLQNVYETHDVVQIDGIELILCEPELTSFNKLVRDKLNELNVQFGVSN